jgi:hypothetical protein
MKTIRLNLSEEQAVILRELLRQEHEGIMHRVAAHFSERAVSDAADVRGMLRQVEEGLE